MKTSEFIKYFEDEGFRLYQDDTFLSVTDEKDFVLFYIKRGVDLVVRFSDTDLPFSKKQEYYKVIFEYLMTPPEEREEEKKYYLKLKGFKEPYNILNFGERTQNYFISTDDNIFGFKNQFTQSEIDELPEYYTHPAVWEQEEVESEE